MHDQVHDVGQLAMNPEMQNIHQVRVTQPVCIHSPVVEGRMHLDAMNPHGVIFSIFWLIGAEVRSGLLYLAPFEWKDARRKELNRGSIMATAWETLRCSVCAERAQRGLPAKEWHFHPKCDVTWKTNKGRRIPCRYCNGPLERTNRPYQGPTIPEGMKDELEAQLGKPHDGGLLPEVFVQFAAGTAPQGIWNPDMAKSAYVHDMANKELAEGRELIPYTLCAGMGSAQLRGAMGVVVSAQPKAIGSVYSDVLYRNDARPMDDPDRQAYTTEFLRRPRW